MPRIAPVERRRKDTAFEALEDVLKELGRQRRPSVGDAGFPAVQYAIVLWKGITNWKDLTTTQQREALDTHSSWRAYRRKRGAQCLDLDLTKLAKYKTDIKALLANAQSPKDSTTNRRSETAPLDPKMLSFSGKADEFYDWTMRTFSQMNISNNTSKAAKKWPRGKNGTVGYSPAVQWDPQLGQQPACKPARLILAR